MCARKSTTTPSEAAHALARSQVYAYLSRGFLYPEGVAAAYLQEQGAAVKGCLEALGVPSALPALASLQEALSQMGPGGLEAAYIATFGHTISRECPPYEAEYGQADVFQKTEALADIGGFYRAFGVEPRLPDRLDHLSVELEFLHLLALKETYALAQGHGAERVALCRDAQARFLEAHPGRWIGGFASRVAPRGGGTAYGTLAELASRFVAWDLGRYGLLPPPPPALSGEEVMETPCVSCSGPSGPGEVADE